MVQQLAEQLGWKADLQEVVQRVRAVPEALAKEEKEIVAEEKEKREKKVCQVCRVVWVFVCSPQAVPPPPQGCQGGSPPPPQGSGR